MSEATFEEMIDQSVDRYCYGPLSEDRKLDADTVYHAARVRETVEQEKGMRKTFFKSFFTERHPEWRIASLVAPGNSKNLIACSEPLPWPLTDDSILQLIEDMRSLGLFSGDPRTQTEIEQDRKEAQAQASIVEAKLREELIEKLMRTVASKNDPKITRMDEEGFQRSRRDHRSWLNTLPTETLQQRVVNMEGARKFRSMGSSTDISELRKAVREGQTANTIATAASAERECPTHALDPSWTAERIKRASLKELQELTMCGGQPRPVAPGSVYTVRQMVNDRLAGRS